MRMTENPPLTQKPIMVDAPPNIVNTTSGINVNDNDVSGSNFVNGEQTRNK
jgi:hypothetical protein